MCVSTTALVWEDTVVYNYNAEVDMCVYGGPVLGANLILFVYKLRL